jgi:hypothetical protein
MNNVQSRFEDIIYSATPQEILINKDTTKAMMAKRILTVRSFEDTRITYAKIVRFCRDKSPQDTPVESSGVASAMIVGHLAGPLRNMTEDRAARIRKWFEMAREDFEQQFS